MKKLFFSFIVCCVASCHVMADPYVGYLYPAGIKAGTTVRVLVGGQALHGITGCTVSGKGVRVKKVVVVPGFPNAAGTQHRYLVKWMKDIESGNPAKPPLPDEMVVNEWRKCSWWDKLDQLGEIELMLVQRSLFVRRNPLQQTPSLRNMVILDIEADADAAPGVRELRLYGRRGVSAPKLFFIDRSDHYLEPPYTPPYKKQPEIPRLKAVPAVVNGQIMPGETDSFIVPLAANQEYTFTLTGRRFQPFIGDAVPGHFQPVLELVSPDGKPVAFADDEYFQPDPVLRFKSGKAGDYLLKIRDNLYRGREDFVYRVALEVGNKPFKTVLKSFRNMDEMSESAARGRRIYIGRPVVIAGGIDKPGEKDVFRFIGKKGMRFHCELAARRDGSPLDGVFTLTGPDGKVIKVVDDDAKPINVGAVLQQIDPAMTVVLPADGIYTIALHALNGEGGKDYRYRLKLGVQEPDFNVYTVRSMCNIPVRSSNRVKVLIDRTGGFNGEVRIYGGNGVVPSQIVKPGVKEFQLLIRNPARRMAPPLNIRIYAEITVKGRTIRKPVIPADIFNQAFAYDHLLPAESFCIGSRPAWSNRKSAPKAAPKSAPKSAPKAAPANAVK